MWGWGPLITGGGTTVRDGHKGIKRFLQKGEKKSTIRSRYATLGHIPKRSITHCRETCSFLFIAVLITPKKGKQPWIPSVENWIMQIGSLLNAICLLRKTKLCNSQIKHQSVWGKLGPERLTSYVFSYLWVSALICQIHVFLLEYPQMPRLLAKESYSVLSKKIGHSDIMK